MRRSRLKIFLLYFAPQFSVYTKFGIDPKNTIFIQNGNLKSELQYLMDQTEQAKETHRMEIVNDIYKKLHDLDYFLLRYGPKDVAKYVEDNSTVSKYYGTLPFY